MKVLLGIVAGISVMTASLVGYLKLGSTWHATTKNETAIFGSEHDAAHAGSSTIQTDAPLSRAQQGERLAVLWDTYGKDYWACYVRTSSGERGWVLCTNLQQVT